MEKGSGFQRRARVAPDRKNRATTTPLVATASKREAATTVCTACNPQSRALPSGWPWQQRRPQQKEWLESEHMPNLDDAQPQLVPKRRKQAGPAVVLRRNRRVAARLQQPQALTNLQQFQLAVAKKPPRAWSPPHVNLRLPCERAHCCGQAASQDPYPNVPAGLFRNSDLRKSCGGQQSGNLCNSHQCWRQPK